MTESFIRSALLQRHGFTGLFTTRAGGVSKAPFDSLNFGLNLGDSDENIAANMARLRERAGIAEPHQAQQIHDRDVLWCEGPGSFHREKADALLGSGAGTALAVRTADCLPILLADPVTGMAAAIHSGWRGTAANIASATIDAMVARGARPETIIASLGPCIGPCCFVIDSGTAGVIAGSSDSAPEYVRYSDGRYTADLAAINRDQLLATGLEADHIEMLANCTSCDAERFYSHRRDQGKSGRHLAVVAIPAST